MKKRILFLLMSCILLGSAKVKSQYSLQDSAAFVTMIYATYMYQFPGGDMVHRFGSNSNIGGGLALKNKHNWMLALDGGYMFGEDVKNANSLFSGIATSDGNIIDGNGTYAEVHLYERGYHFQLKIGYILPILQPNPNSGLMVQIGGGFIEHKIRIENPENSAPQILGDYQKGYDKLSNGWMLNETVGFLYMGKRRLTNFFLGLEFMQGFTKSRRDYDFNLQGKDMTQRTDLLTGLRFSWIIPIYDRGKTHYYSY